MSTFRLDIRYAIRMLARSPGWTAAAVLTLALGIGANSAIFSVVRGVLLKPLGYREQGLVMLWESNPKQGYEENPPSAADVADWRRETRSFDSLALVDGRQQFNLSAADRPERADGAAVDASLFPLLGVRPAIGRAFLTDEQQSGQNRVVILSDSLWSRRFHRDPAVLNGSLRINGVDFTVVGVMPAGFQFPGGIGALGGGAPPPAAELWIPLTLTPAQWSQRSDHHLLALGRCKNGVDSQIAAAEISAIQKRIERDHVNDYVGSQVKLVPLRAQAVGSVRDALWILFGAVAFLLWIACANIANLILARAASRRREMGIRTALGATGARLARQLLTEGLCLALAGGLLGILLAVWGVDLIRLLLPAEFPRAAEIRVDSLVVAFTLVASLAAGLLSSLVPALRARRLDVHMSLHAPRGAAEVRGATRLRHLLAVIQMALALLLSTGALLMARSLAHLERVASGIDPTNVLTLEITLPGVPYGDRPSRARFFRSLTQRLEARSGVLAAGVTTQLPLSGENMNFALEVEGRATGPGEFPSADLRAVSRGYFSALRIPLRSGRLFSETDNADSPHVLLVNEALARHYFPGRSPIGQGLTLGVNRFRGEIVGVVGDVRQVRLEEPAHEEAYVLYDQAPFWPTARLVVRASGSPLGLRAAVLEEVRALDPGQAVAAVRTMEEVVRRCVAQPRFRASLAGVFGALALGLSAVGLYGVLGYSVARRTREIGIRMALGAQVAQVMRLVLAQALSLTALGLALGIAGALVATRLLSSLLYGISPTDPATFAGSALLLAGVAAVASYLPTRRAARVDPTVALRAQ